MEQGIQGVNSLLSRGVDMTGPYRRGLVRATDAYRWNTSAWLSRCNSDVIQLHADLSPLARSHKDPLILRRNASDGRTIHFGIGVDDFGGGENSGVQRLAVSDGEAYVLYERTRGKNTGQQTQVMIGLLEKNEHIIATCVMREFVRWNKGNPVSVDYDVQRTVSADLPRDTMDSMGDWVVLADQLFDGLGEDLYPNADFLPPDKPDSFPSSPSGALPRGWSPFGGYGSTDPVPV